MKSVESSVLSNVGENINRVSSRMLERISIECSLECYTTYHCFNRHFNVWGASLSLTRPTPPQFAGRPFFHTIVLILSNEKSKVRSILQSASAFAQAWMMFVAPDHDFWSKSVSCWFRNRLNTSFFSRPWLIARWSALLPPVSSLRLRSQLGNVSNQYVKTSTLPWHCFCCDVGGGGWTIKSKVVYVQQLSSTHPIRSHPLLWDRHHSWEEYVQCHDLSYLCSKLLDNFFLVIY